MASARESLGLVPVEQPAQQRQRRDVRPAPEEQVDADGQEHDPGPAIDRGKAGAEGVDHPRPLLLGLPWPHRAHPPLVEAILAHGGRGGATPGRMEGGEVASARWPGGGAYGAAVDAEGRAAFDDPGDVDVVAHGRLLAGLLHRLGRHVAAESEVAVPPSARWRSGAVLGRAGAIGASRRRAVRLDQRHFQPAALQQRALAADEREVLAEPEGDRGGDRALVVAAAVDPAATVAVAGAGGSGVGVGGGGVAVAREGAGVTVGAAVAAAEGVAARVGAGANRSQRWAAPWSAWLVPPGPWPPWWGWSPALA